MIKTYLFTKSGTQEDVSLDNWQSLVEDDGSKILWVDVRDFNQTEINQLTQQFGLHAVAIRSCIDHYRRPHLLEFHDHFYVNLTVVKKRGSNGPKPSELNLFVGNRFIITITKEKKSDAVDKAIQNYIDTPSLCAHGTMYAAYLLAEDLVETYYPIIEKLDDSADTIESDMLEHPTESTLKTLFDLKKDIFELRKLLGSQRDVFSELSMREFPFIDSSDRVYFQDVYSRMVRLFDMMDTIREILSGSLDIYLSSVSNRLNDIVKVLTIASIILMTLSFLTGFYGMNFVHLPWLEAPNAFRNIVFLMTGMAVGMLYFFRKIKWL